MRAWMTIMTIALITTLTTMVSAQERLTLDYRAPEGCPDTGDFADETAARLGYLPFAEGAAQRVEVRVFSDGSAYMGTLSLNGAPGRSMSDGSCAVLVESLAAALAVQLGVEPSAAVPAAAVPTVTAPRNADTESGQIRVRVVNPSGQRLELHRVIGTHQVVVSSSEGSASGSGISTEPICAAPCEISLNEGYYRFALSHEDRMPLEIGDGINLESDTVLRVDYESRLPEQIFGTATMWFGLLGGGGLALSSLAAREDPDLLVGLIASGSGVFLVSMIVGAYFKFLSDIPEVTVSDPEAMQLSVAPTGFRLQF